MPRPASTLPRKSSSFTTRAPRRRRRQNQPRLPPAARPPPLLSPRPRLQRHLHLSRRRELSPELRPTRPRSSRAARAQCPVASAARVEFASARKLRERNKLTYRLAPRALWVVRFFISPRPFPLDLFR